MVHFWVPKSSVIRNQSAEKETFVIEISGSRKKSTFLRLEYSYVNKIWGPVRVFRDAFCESNETFFESAVEIFIQIDKTFVFAESRFVI